jgi:hypothetical protein
MATWDTLNQGTWQQGRLRQNRTQYFGHVNVFGKLSILKMNQGHYISRDHLKISTNTSENTITLIHCINGIDELSVRVQYM